MDARILPDSNQFFSVGVKIGCWRSNLWRNLRSEAFVAPRHNSARTTEHVLTGVERDSIRFSWIPVRRSSTKIDVSRIVTLLTFAGKCEFSSILSHQFLESLQSDDFLECQMNRLGSGFNSENLYCLVSQTSVQPDRSHSERHEISPIYT